MSKRQQVCDVGYPGDWPTDTLYTNRHILYSTANVISAKQQFSTAKHCDLEILLCCEVISSFYGTIFVVSTPGDESACQI